MGFRDKNLEPTSLNSTNNIRSQVLYSFVKIRRRAYHLCHSFLSVHKSHWLIGSKGVLTLRKPCIVNGTLTGSVYSLFNR